MTDFSSRSDVERALMELGRQMALRDADPMTIVCCGASALCVLGAFSRRTLDVDAIGMVDPSGEIIGIGEFAPEVKDAITAAGAVLGLTPGWFNAAASAILVRGLPKGAIERSTKHRMEFGPCLTIRFMDRIDLIALKMYAALDPHEGRRHIEDLVSIGPTLEELRHGADWIAGWQSNSSFKLAFRRLLEAFDAADLY